MSVIRSFWAWINAPKAPAILFLTSEGTGPTSRLYLDEGYAVGKPESDAAKWCQLFPKKKKHRSDFGPDKAFDFNDAFLGSMVANFRKLQSQHAAGSFGLQVNYHHRGDSNDALPQGEKVAAGWIEDLELREDGLYALIKWTAKARAHILADEYRYLSPEFAADWQDTDTGRSQGPTLFGAGLLNDPFLKELPRVAASEQSHSAAATNTKAHEAAGDIMDRKLLCASLGLAESATDAEIAAKIETLNAKAAEAEEAKTKLADVKGEVVKLAQAQRDAQAKLEKIEKDAKTAAVKSAHAELVKEGRSQGAQFERFQKLADTLGLDEAKAIFGSFPKQNLSEGGISGEGAGTTETAQQQYTKLMDKFQTELKLSASDAAKKILREHREIALAATTRNDGRPVRA